MYKNKTNNVINDLKENFKLKELKVLSIYSFFFIIAFSTAAYVVHFIPAELITLFKRNWSIVIRFSY